MLPRVTIDAFDAHLFAHQLRFEGVVIGGSALALLGITDRPTQDVDILAPTLPPAIAEPLVEQRPDSACGCSAA